MSLPRSSSMASDTDKKVDAPTYIENAAPVMPSTTGSSKRVGDAALDVLGDASTPVHITAEQDARVLRKIDRWCMPVILMVYFLQQLDKSSLSYTSAFNIVQETHLHGSQYSWLGSIVYVAQLVWQPVSSYLLVKLPVAKYLFVHVFMWGVLVACTAAAKNFGGLLAVRFLLGIFEATVAPCFIIITQMWWRRREQTLRLSAWMAMNGVAGAVGSLLAYGLGQIDGRLKPYQTIFLFIGLLTVACSFVVLFVLPDSPTKARFFSHEEKVVALERLRSNNQGTEAKVWKWDHVWDLATDFKTYLWFSLLFLCALPSGGLSSFGPLIIKGFGFGTLDTILFNAPFGIFQVIITLLSALISQRIKLKWPVIFFLSLPPIAGAAALRVLGRGTELKNTLLGCYYVLSFSTGLQPMLYTWASQNTAGHTKKTAITAVIFVAQCAGNIAGPQLYRTEESPYYHRGLIGSLTCWIALALITLVTALYLHILNRKQAAKRRRMGKKGEVIDTSLESSKAALKMREKALEEKGGEEAQHENAAAINEKAFDDLTDRQNEDFIYAL
ncbi:allantoate permease, partial [Gloeophyllum trabeum ATCC 11539]